MLRATIEAGFYTPYVVDNHTSLSIRVGTNTAGHCGHTHTHTHTSSSSSSSSSSSRACSSTLLFPRSLAMLFASVLFCTRRRADARPILNDAVRGQVCLSWPGLLFQFFVRPVMHRPVMVPTNDPGWVSSEETMTSGTDCI